jgi:hypothetical protein
VACTHAASMPKPQPLLAMSLLCAAAGNFHKPCAPGCEKRGNCNFEEGRCECPFGWRGPTCEEPAFPACRISNSSDMVGRGVGRVHTGSHAPRYCRRQRVQCS